MSIPSTGLPAFARRLSTRLMAQRFGVHVATIDKWTRAGILPQPMRINRLKYWDESEVEGYERALKANRNSDFPPEAA